jgi:hypothetical protein
MRLSVAVLLLCAALAPAQMLKVAQGGRHLQYADGRPFLYLGDTAWELFHRLNREEADLYLRNRAAKGFTVIQAVVLAEREGLTVPNPYGHLPLTDRDPARPVEAYFEHVDYIVNRAAELRLFIGMLPTWGSYWTQGNPKVTPVFNVANARAFGRFLGARYKAKPVIWILGGDQNIRTPGERAVIDAMAEGLAEGDGGAHLRTFHPRGPGMSSLQLRDAKWLDFHMSQSSHGARDHDTGLYIEHDRALNPPKPTLDGEPRYEMIPVGFYYANFSRLDRMDDFDARTAAYWAMLAGAAGHTYGHNSVWQMWKPGLPSVIHADIPWMQAIDHPGAFQMGHLRRLFESRPWQTLVPDQSIIRSGTVTGPGTIRAARAADGRFAFIYSPRGEPFTVDRAIIKAARVKEIWWDPRYGVAHHVHSSDNQALQTYVPPTSGRGQDWLLILEDEAAKFPLPVP